MKNITKILLGFNAGSAFIDIATTVFLLAIGSKNGVVFQEANPLMAIGVVPYVAIYVIVTAVICSIIWYLDTHYLQFSAHRVPNEGIKSLPVVWMCILSSYGVIHLIMGIHNIQVIQQFVV